MDYTIPILALTACMLLFAGVLYTFEVRLAALEQAPDPEAADV